METTSPLEDVLSALAAEIARQDALHPAGFPATRDGLRLGLAYAQDELNEALEAHRAERCKCPLPACDHARWTRTRTEALQAAAVLLRLARAITVQEQTDQLGRAEEAEPHFG
jgi:hypothetical protein